MNNSINNNINFTGIRNIAFTPSIEAVGHGKFSNSLSMVLSDDFNGKDLTEFKKVICKISSKPFEYANDVSSDILNIKFLHGKNNQLENIFVNGKNLQVNDKNLPMFSFIAKLTKRIGQMSDKNIVVNNDYVENVAERALVYGEDLSQYMPFNDKQKSFGVFIEKNWVRQSAQKTNEFIQKMMESYLGI